MGLEFPSLARSALNTRSTIAWKPFAIVVALALGLSACAGTASSAPPQGRPNPIELRLGYFPNLTHAPGLVGIGTGEFQRSLGTDVKLIPTVFKAGPAAVEALFAGSVDAAFIGPNPAVNAFAKSNGDAIRIVSGSTSGGAALVVRTDIDKADDLRGATVASPQIGSTQDISLRAWLKENGLTSGVTGAGEVSVVPQPNSQTLDAFRQGRIDGAWVPEPWATRLVREAGGRVLVDERDLWPDGKWATTVLVVRTDYLKASPDAISRLLSGLERTIASIHADPAEAQAVLNDQIEAVTGKRIAPEILNEAWGKVQFTTDPLPESIRESADRAVAVDLLDPVDIDGIFDTDLLSESQTRSSRDSLEGK
ncbi:MAG: ABC transporter substrate-binding protein [Microthrixaceae bacterium]